MSDQQQGNLHLLNDPEFKELVHRKNTISIQLTIVTLAIYYGFIFLIAYKRDLFANKIKGNVTFGIFIGISVILACWVLTGIYVRWANKNYDAMVTRLKEKAGPPAEASAKAGHAGP
jgi:uncharacterized membrane protein (DUF485 family)